ncbi:MAG: RNA methyltransferase [Leptolyngbyaceae bacterium]|nr:RNA methyltransferase [Leptolyngbyaceae bacterium]
MTNSPLPRIRIVLVEPAGPLNLGSVARVMKNMGLTRLVLVNPHCHPDEDEARQMAVHAGDVLESAQMVSTLPDALVGCHRAVATTSRERDLLGDSLEHPRQVLPWLLGDRPATQRASETNPPLDALESALIFGPEDRGLSNTELSYAQRYLKIPTSPIYPSMNLAQAVAVCCYEIRQLILDRQENLTVQLDIPLEDISEEISEKVLGDAPGEINVAPPAPIDDLEGFYQHLEETLLRIGYVLPHTAHSRMKKFRRLFNRAELSVEEVSMLRGILRQVGWATHQKNGTERDATD